MVISLDTDCDHLSGLHTEEVQTIIALRSIDSDRRAAARIKKDQPRAVVTCGGSPLGCLEKDAKRC